MAVFGCWICHSLKISISSCLRASMYYQDIGWIFPQLNLPGSLQGDSSNVAFLHFYLFFFSTFHGSQHVEEEPKLLLGEKCSWLKSESYCFHPEKLWLQRLAAVVVERPVCVEGWPQLKREAAYVTILALPFTCWSVPSVFSVLSLLGGGNLQFSCHRVVHLKYVDAF